MAREREPDAPSALDQLDPLDQPPPRPPEASFMGREPDEVDTDLPGRRPVEPLP